MNWVRGGISCSSVMSRILQDGASPGLREKVLALSKPLVRSQSHTPAGTGENRFNDQSLETACDVGEVEKGTAGVVGRTLLRLFEETLLQTRSL